MKLQNKQAITLLLRATSFSIFAISISAAINSNSDQTTTLSSQVTSPRVSTPSSLITTLTSSSATPAAAQRKRKLRPVGKATATTSRQQANQNNTNTNNRPENEASKPTSTTATSNVGISYKQSSPNGEPDLVAALSQEHARLMASYSNTPPLFMTQTRDLFVDVGRQPPGSRITTIRAHDIEGDPLQYSLKPAVFKDASDYFKINSTSGELRLAQRQFRYHLPRKISFTTNESSTIIPPEEVTTESMYNDRDELLADDDQQQGSDQGSSIDEHEDQLSRNLYSLIVFADDGHLGSNAEFQIHVINSTSIASLQSLPSMAVPLAPANELSSKNMLGIMQQKAKEYYTNLMLTSTTNSPTQTSIGKNHQVMPPFNGVGSTDLPMLVLPDFVNPGMVKPTIETGLDTMQNIEEIVPVNISSQQQDVTMMLSSNRAMEPKKRPPLTPTPLLEQPNESLTREDQIVSYGQPLFMGFLVVCTCLLMISYLIMSQKRLRRRLKEVERQHEHLSKKGSNNSSSSYRCSTTGTHSISGTNSHLTNHHMHNSSLSQFTLSESEVSSCPMRRGAGLIYRQSSLDSATSQLGDVFSQQSSMLTSHCPRTNSDLHHHHHHQQQQQEYQHQNQQSRAILAARGQQHVAARFGNQGSIIKNPVFLQQSGHHHYPIMQAHSYQLSTAQSNQASSTVKQQQQPDAVYYPIDDNLYCTIQTDGTQHQQQNTKTTTLSSANNANFSLLPAPAIVHNLFRHSRANQCQQTPFNLTTTNAQLVDSADHLHHQLQSQNNIDKRRPCSPNGSGYSSSSSTKSLARFLSLPARHPSHQRERQQEHILSLDNNRYSPNNMDSLNCLANSKTIARGSQLSREPKVAHNWEIERHKLKFLDILDEGQFGLVWRCKLRKQQHDASQQDSQRTVAVKTLKNSASRDERGREELLAEIEIMKLVCQHPNVVRILHSCTLDSLDQLQASKPILLVMEYVELGKLQAFLEKCRHGHHYATTKVTSFSGNRIKTVQNNDDDDACLLFNTVDTNPYCNNVPFNGSIADANSSGASKESTNNMSKISTTSPDYNVTSKDLIKFIYHVAKGMEYLSSKCIVHRDLASRNVLLSSGRICKIGDFGMARHMQSYSGVYERSSRNSKVPVRWMAPEVLLQNTFTTKSDVYSFGILMWEIVTLASTPYYMLKTEQVIEEVARKGQRPEKPEYCHKDLYKIMQLCWSEEAAFRPTFSELVKQLDELLLSANDYIELDQYPDHNYYNIIPRTSAPLELL